MQSDGFTPMHKCVQEGESSSWVESEKQILQGPKFEDYRTSTYCVKIMFKSDIINAYVRMSSWDFARKPSVHANTHTVTPSPDITKG